MKKTKLVVVNEHTLGYIDPLVPKNYSILHASILKGATFELHPGPKSILQSDKIRLASKKDFDDFRVHFSGFNDPEKYEFDHSHGIDCEEIESLW